MKFLLWLWDTLMETIGIVIVVIGYSALRVIDWLAAIINDEEYDDDDH